MARYFTPSLFAFIRELKDNNEDRIWFKANQDRFEEVVREPALDFISDFAAPLMKVSPHFTADPRKVGGSLFRIQRDVRFSKDKSPYKEHVGIHFRHIATKEDVHSPGLYLHLDPAGSFAALGLWQPSTADANKIREAIVDDPAAWKKAAYNKRFADTYEMSGESLKRPPRGFDPEHPLLEDLKKKEFIASSKLTQAEVTSPDFMNIYLERVKVGTPFIKFLTEAVGQNF